jgi:acetylornithine deacetylase/succinyl-diaminopimelate desuccinylase-like protein
MPRLLFLGVLVVISATAQVREWVQKNQQPLLREFTELLAIPNIAFDTPNIRKNAAAIQAMFENRGVRTRLLEAPGSPPAVYGELTAPGATKTVVFYAHYDGQPVNPSEWETGDPFKPVLRGGRLYGRSTSDDKAAILAMAAALDALKASGRPRGVNLKFFFEGEEEAGSQHLPAIVRANAALLKADIWLICDGPVHQSGRQQVYFGARGVTGMEITVYGANRELHSGHYGGWSPNPAVMLAHLISSMRDENGRVLIPGFYSDAGALSPAEKQAIAETPSVDASLTEQFGLKRRENSGRKIEEIVNEPTLNIRGLRSADTGKQSRNVVPASATVSIEIRLVKGISPEQAQDRVIAHLKNQGYHVTEEDPGQGVRLAYPKVAKVTRSGGYAAAKTPMDLPAAQNAVKAIEAVTGAVVKAPTLGGSVPLYIFEQELRTPFIGVPIANHDNNQHAANENIRLANLWAGIEVMAALMTMK